LHKNACAQRPLFGYGRLSVDTGEPVAHRSSVRVRDGGRPGTRGRECRTAAVCASCPGQGRLRSVKRTLRLYDPIADYAPVIGNELFEA
jgi:hypothetical protein